MQWEQVLKEWQACCCPAGDGVFTVHTGEGRKARLQRELYGDDVQSAWLETLREVPDCKVPLVLGVPSDTGGGIQRGANWGPLMVREAIRRRHPEVETKDMGDIRVIPHLLHDKYLNKATIASCRKSLYGSSRSDLPVSPLSIAEHVVESFWTLYPKKRLFALGGDHSVSYPLVHGYVKAKTKQCRKVGVLHFDAHTDLLKERLGIDICFGSWAAHIIPELASPDCLLQVGIRSTGKPQSYWEETFGVKQIWAEDIVDASRATVGEMVVEHFRQLEIDELYISFDIDALDSHYAAATGTPEPDGLKPETAIGIIQACGKHLSVAAADLVEVAPFVCSDPLRRTHEPDTTLSTASDIAAELISALQPIKQLL